MRCSTAYLVIMRISALLFALLVPAFAGCGSMPASGSDTQLTIRAVNSSVGRSEFHLSCEPPGGDLPDPARACAALTKDPGLVTITIQLDPALRPAVRRFLTAQAGGLPVLSYQEAAAAHVTIDTVGVIRNAEQLSEV